MLKDIERIEKRETKVAAALKARENVQATRDAIKEQSTGVKVKSASEVTIGSKVVILSGVFEDEIGEVIEIAGDTACVELSFGASMSEVVEVKLVGVFSL